MRGLLRQLWIVIAFVVAGAALTWVWSLPASEQRGVWQSVSGDTILSVSPLRIRQFSATSVSCTQNLTLPAHMKLLELARGVSLTTEADNLLMRVNGTLGPIPFTRLESLPQDCNPPDPNASPQSTFAAMWAAMERHYAAFARHGVIWSTRNTPPDQTLDDPALFTHLCDGLRGLDDPALRLLTPIGTCTPADPRPGNPAPIDPVKIARDTVGTPLIPIELTGIAYTLLPDGVAYVLIEDLRFQTPIGPTERTATARAIEQLTFALQPASAIIIDARFATGGSGTLALALAAPFTDKPLDLFAKSATQPRQIITLTPAQTPPLTQPVLLLTGPQTAGAGEILTLALRATPNAVLMGARTAGALFDIASITLPNGWILRLPRAPYTAPDGTPLQIGLTPDIAVAREAAALANGEDPLLRAAFARARTQD